MTKLLDDVHSKRRAFDDAVRHRDECASAARKQETSAEQLRSRIGTLRSSLVDQRIAAAGGSDTAVTLTPRDLEESEIDAEVAETLARQLAERAEAAGKSASDAESAWHNAVCAYVQDLESIALGEAQTALSQLSSACGRAIAAAEVSKEHGQIRGSYNLPTSRWYGSAGDLVDQLRDLKWPTWPTPIEACGFKRQYINDSVLKHPGVCEALTEIDRALELGVS